MLGREGKLEASRRSSLEPGSCFSRYVRRMIIEDQLDRGAGRIRGVETLEEFDELPAAVAVSDERMDLPGKQVDSGQQAQRAMTFVLVIPREGRVDAGLGRQIGCGGCDGLDSRLFVVGNDRHSLDGFARLGGGSLQNLDLAINAQNLRHLLLELGIATFQIVADLVRLDFLLAEDLAHRALNQLGETFVPRHRSVLACVTCQKPRRPQLMRIAVLLGLVARQRHQPGFGLRCDDRFFARPWPILDRRQRPIAQRPLHAALNRLMVNPNSLPHRTERRILAIGQQHLRPRYPAGSVRDRERAVNLSISSSVIANSTARRHPAIMPLLVSPTAKQGIRHQPIGSMMQVSWNPSSSTTLADLFTLLLFADLSSAVRASLRSWSNDEFDDGLAYGRQARLRRRPVDSFFSAPLVRVGDAGGTRRRSLS